jgi:hypothetical protein
MDSAKLDIRANHAAAAGDALPVDLQVCAGARWSTGTLILAHKEELQREIEHQLTLGPEGLGEDDRFLLECNFGELASMNGEQQEY